MTDKMLEIAAPLVRPPACKSCGQRMTFEPAAISKIGYTADVRLSCACGNAGAWQSYALYDTSIPALADLLRRMVSRYEGGEPDDPVSFGAETDREVGHE